MWLGIGVVFGVLGGWSGFVSTLSWLFEFLVFIVVKDLVWERVFCVGGNNVNYSLILRCW